MPDRMARRQPQTSLRIDERPRQALECREFLVHERVTVIAARCHAGGMEMLAVDLEVDVTGLVEELDRSVAILERLAGLVSSVVFVPGGIPGARRHFLSLGHDSPIA